MYLILFRRFIYAMKWGQEGVCMIQYHWGLSKFGAQLFRESEK